MIYDPRSIARDGEYLDLDPFAFWPTYQSRLSGVGGTEQSEDPDYVFHTLYVACGSGPIAFHVDIAGLQASRGTLILRIHELPDGIGSTARQLGIMQAQLADLVRADGRVLMENEARVGNTYALLGHIYGDAVASATTLAIRLAREAPNPNNPNRPTEFMSSQVGSATLLVGTHLPVMITPVSQVMTRTQARESIYRDVVARIGTAATPHEEWERVYLLRTLERYGFAEAGARGLVLDGDREPALVAALTAAGCRVIVGQRAAPADEARDVLVLDPDDLPDDLPTHDFACARRTFGADLHWKDALARIEDMIRAVKPKGLLVLTLSVVADEYTQPGAREIGWHDLSRIALVLISRGHQVAQLRRGARPRAGREERETVFGFIVRRRA